MSSFSLLFKKIGISLCLLMSVSAVAPVSSFAGGPNPLNGQNMQEVQMGMGFGDDFNNLIQAVMNLTAMGYSMEDVLRLYQNTTIPGSVQLIQNVFNYTQNLVNTYGPSAQGLMTSVQYILDHPVITVAECTAVATGVVLAGCAFYHYFIKPGDQNLIVKLMKSCNGKCSKNDHRDDVEESESLIPHQFNNHLSSHQI